MKRTLLAFMFTLASLGTLAAQDSIIHVLKRGETIYGLSHKYHAPYELILKANNITDVRALRVGQKLLIPSTYAVVTGDTLYSIARRFGVSVGDLETANGLAAGAVLRPGEALYIPAVKAAPRGTDTGSPASAREGKVAVADGTKSPRIVAGVLRQPGDAPDTASSPAVKQPTKVAPAGKDKGTGAKKADALSGTATPDAAPASDAGKDPADPLAGPWPVKGDIRYVQGKLYGVTIQGGSGDQVVAVAAGTVVSAGPYRGYGNVVFVQAPGGYIYVYGGNSTLAVRVGQAIHPGDVLATVGLDAREKKPLAYFFVYRNNKAVDPARAPRS